MKKQILAASIIILVALALFAQTPPPNCTSGNPKCYSDLVAYQGHGPASSLPSTLCSNCSGNDRRVIVVRIDSSWGSTTNTNVWNATNCAINAWNNATDGSGNKIGYYFVLDQGGATGVTNADITISQDSNQSDFAECDVQVNSGSTTRRNHIELSPANGTLGNGAFTGDDVCGRIKHEMGHLMGLANNSLCNTIMRGTQETGTRLVNNVQANDVARVNTHFADVDNCGNYVISNDSPKEEVEPTPTPTPEPTPEESGLGQCNDGLDNDGDSMIDCEESACNHYCPNGCSNYQWAVCIALGGAGCVDGFCYTPVLIDTLGNGFRLTTAKDGVVFNVLPDMPVKLAWTAPDTDDAWLVLDRNGNGQVDSGQELFGNATPQAQPPVGLDKNGFLALVEYDSSANGGNGDGVIDQSDAIFSQLLLWQDKNHNGISEPSELHGLLELGIASMECNYKESKRTDEFGNKFRYRAKVKDVRGAQVGRWAWDVFLRMAP